MRLLSVTRAVALLLIAAPVQAQSPSSATPPTLEDLFRYQNVGGAQLSPDGSLVLYTVSTSNLAENKTDTEIWMVRTSGGRPIRLTHNPRPDTRPRWRPDGATFAFISTRGEGANARAALYMMSPVGGEPEKLYEHATGVATFEWSPDGRTIAFTAQQEETKEQKDAKEVGRDAEIEDGPQTHSHLWVLDVETRKASRVTGAGEEAGAFTVQGYAWAPDSRRIAFSAAPTPNLAFSWQSDLYLVSATDSASRATRITDNPGPDNGPSWSADGGSIYYTGYQTDAYRVGQNRLFRIAAEGGRPEDVTPGDLEPGSAQPSRDGRGIWFSTVTGTVTAIFYMPLATRQPVRLTPESGVHGGFTLSADESRIAFTRESPTEPAELYTTTLRRQNDRPQLGAPVALTTHNTEMAKYAVGRSEVLKWKSTDGRDVEGIVVYPAGYTPGRRVPLVVKIHGGPSGVYTQNFQAAGYGSNAQWYAADGYATLLPNPRGSSGYGDAGQRSVIEDWGGLDFQDIMTGVDALVERGVAHPDSLGVMGWSYGGYMTAWTVTQTDRFKAAVNGAGITEPISMWGTQDIIQVFEGYFGGSPFDEGRWEVYQKSSPMAHVRNTKTPTLMIHGRNDARVPPNQAQIFFRSLRALGVPTELVWLPRTGHGPSEPGLQFETARRQKEWMDRWIRGRKTPVT